MRGSFKHLWLTTLVLFAGSVAAGAFSTEEPGYSGDVCGITGAGSVDIVAVSGGWESGFRNGMKLQVSRGERSIAQLIAVSVDDCKTHCLIVALAEDETIHSGDKATVLVKPL